MSGRALKAARRAAAQAAAGSNAEVPSSGSESDEPEPEQKVYKVAAKPLPKAKAFWQEACRLGVNVQYPEFVNLV
eukprot:1142471-Pelagomonas_calceolata.AAC.7